MAHELD
jgi:hypothetical protein